MKNWTVLIGYVALAWPGLSLSAQEPSAIYRWIERPWEFRYFLRIDTVADRDWGIQDWKKSLQTSKQGGLASYQGIFPYTEVAKVPQTQYDSENGETLAKLVIEFDKDTGNIMTPHTGPKGLKGHLSGLYDIVLAAGQSESDWHFTLAHWYTGRDDSDLVFTPALCDGRDMDDSTATLGRYRKGYKAGFTYGNFGCREWGYYLQSEKHPYIDITSYQWEDDEDKPAGKKGKRPKKLVSYVHATIGWGRFDVPPKPVIGKAFDTWVCFHECPNGEAPGVISDIKAWSAKNGWPEPKPPKKQPMFPDKPYKPGEFVD